MTPRMQLLSAVFVIPLAVSAAAQSFQPKSIQFKGDSDHTDAELLAASGLKMGMVLTAAQMNDRTKQLMDSGMFQDITFTYNGQDLVLQLIPAQDLYSLSLENLPIAGGKELDDRIHAQLPLYHGKVPLQGTMLDGVSKALEDELTAKGILHATVIAAPHTDLGLGKVTAMEFSVTAPAIKIGEIQWGLTPAIMASKARAATAKIVGSAYSTDGSVSQIETNVGNLYRDQGYLEVQVHATAQSKFTVDKEGVHIPFAVAIEEGPQYKLAGIQLALGLLVSQSAFDKLENPKTGEVVSQERLRGHWEFIARQYHDKGYMKVKVAPTPTYDRAQGSVSYAVAVEPGPQYSMGALRVLGTDDDLQNMIAEAWKIPQGSVFNEGAIRSLTATHAVNIALEQALASMNLFYTLKLHDDVHTVDVDLSLEKKH
jgi:outer membrane protein assembly factor BamA